MARRHGAVLLILSCVGQLVEEASAHELDYTDVVVGQCERDSLRRLKPGKSVV